MTSSVNVKESGIKWVGQIPTEWNTASVNKAFNITLGKMLQPAPSNPGDLLVPYFKAYNVQDGSLKMDKVDSMYCSQKDLATYKLQKGDLLVCEGGEVARSTLLKEDMPGYIIQNSLHVVTARKGNLNSYLHFLLVALRHSGFINILVNKATIAHFTKDKFSSLKIPLPKFEIQKSIVSYLEIKIVEINELVSAKQNLIHLLEQQRQSIITEVVTKGLDPNVKMKDSGVEWIGEIPEHWQVKALKYCFKIGNGKEIENELAFDDLNGVNVYGSGGVFKKTDKVLFDGESVLFGRKGTIGKPVYVNESFWTVDTMYFTKFNSESYAKWFYYLLTVYPWNTITTHTALPSVVGSDIANSICGIPSYQEQIEIAQYLSKKDIEITRLINKIKQSIEKLKEYRQSLIYEVVTGKIDVSEMELEEVR